MNTSSARQIVLAARPDGKPKLTDFRVEETAIPTPTSGQILLGTDYLSLDPYMRGRMDDRKSYAKPLQVDDVMTGEAVARVIASNRPDYSVGDILLAQTGWRTHALSDVAGLRKLDPAMAPVTAAPGSITTNSYARLRRWSLLAGSAIANISSTVSKEPRSPYRNARWEELRQDYSASQFFAVASRRRARERGT